MGRRESGRELRNIQGFREWGRGALDAGRSEPSWDAGMDPQERRGETCVVLCSRNAHDRNVLVRRAQWENQAGLHSVYRENEQAWRELLTCVALRDDQFEHPGSPRYEAVDT